MGYPDVRSRIGPNLSYKNTFENILFGFKSKQQDFAIHFQKSISFWLSVLITAMDIAAVGLVVTFVIARSAPGLLETVGIFLVASSFLAVSQWSGVGHARTFDDFSESIRRFGAISLVWIAATAAGSLLLLGPIAAASATMIVSATAIISLTCRVILAALALRFADEVAERVLLVGRDESIARPAVVRSIQTGRLRPVGVILIGGGSSSLPSIGAIGIDHLRRIEGLSIDVNFAHLLKGLDRIVVCRDGLDREQLSVVMEILSRFSSEVHLSEEAGWDNPFDPAFDIITHRVRRATISTGSQALKRAFDVSIALLALVLLAPAMVIIGLLIRLESRGPALFKQIRLGCNNLPFTVLKFRTMRQGSVGAANGSVQARRNDPRVTRFGAILRKTSMDELPQLLNVLGGSMSLVGPRPHPTDLNRRFEPLVAGYAARHSVPPGITGWAQVNGSRGETPTKEAMQRRIDFDLDYIQRRSIGLDLWIIIRSFVSVMATKNVY